MCYLLHFILILFYIWFVIKFFDIQLNFIEHIRKILDTFDMMDKLLYSLCVTKFEQIVWVNRGSRIKSDCKASAINWVTNARKKINEFNDSICIQKLCKFLWVSQKKNTIL